MKSRRCLKLSSPSTIVLLLVVASISLLLLLILPFVISIPSVCALLLLLVISVACLRSTGRQDDYEALESATLKEADQGCSRCNPTETETKIKNGFAEVFNQFQSIESQNDVSFG